MVGHSFELLMNVFNLIRFPGSAWESLIQRLCLIVSHYVQQYYLFYYSPFDI